jgi:hypothetical protein
MAPEGQALRAIDRQSEKEFLLGLRRLALSNAAALTRADSEAPESAAIEPIRLLLQGLPLAHQQIILLKLSGYEDSSIEKLLRVAPTMIGRACESQPDLRPPGADAWFRFLAYSWRNATEDCTTARKLVRMQEGQASWYDREPVERHMTACLHCLELWTSLAEVRYWRREARPLPEAEGRSLLESIGVATAR